MRSVLDDLPRACKLISYGHNFNAVLLKEIECEIHNLEATGNKASVLMVDLKTLGGVAYNIGQTFCVQSTVKAIAVESILENDYENALKSNGRLMRDAIVDSSDDAYEKLYKIYGNEAIKKSASEVGVDPYVVNIMYPRFITTRDMVKLWTKLYEFFNSGADKDNFAKYYAASVASATSEVLRDRVPVQTKAGWENSPKSSNDKCSCNDCGIVYDKNGPYIFAIFTGIPYDAPEENPLKHLAELLFALHGEL